MFGNTLALNFLEMFLKNLPGYFQERQMQLHTNYMQSREKVSVDPVKYQLIVFKFLRQKL